MSRLFEDPRCIFVVLQWDINRLHRHELSKLEFLSHNRHVNLRFDIPASCFEHGTVEKIPEDARSIFEVFNGSNRIERFVFRCTLGKGQAEFNKAMGYCQEIMTEDGAKDRMSPSQFQLALAWTSIAWLKWKMEQKYYSLTDV
jgi:hypothetical protein